MIAVVFDAGYLPWAATLIRSIADAHEADGVSIEVLHEGSLTVPDLRKLESIVADTTSAIRFHEVDHRKLAGLPVTSDFGTIVWLRFFLPSVLTDRSRVLYLDADTYVVSPILELWNTHLDGTALGAVANVVEPSVRRHVSELGVRYPGGFFNSGVLLLDLELMRKEDSTQQLLQFAMAHRSQLLWPDQDALNSVFADRWKPLHPRWNAQNSLWTWQGWALEVFSDSELRAATMTPAIRHFEGPSISKPWHYLCPLPWRTEYLQTLRRTPWKDVPMDDRTLATSLLRVLPPHLRIRAYKSLLKARSRFAK